MDKIGIDCSKCPTKGACCCVFEIPKDIVLKNKEKIQVNPVKVIESKDKIRLETFDNRCVFLDRETCSCTIYDDRPEVCKRYGTKSLPCPYFKPNGIERSEASKKQHMRKIMQNIERSKNLN